MKIIITVPANVFEFANILDFDPTFDSKVIGI